jgi:hypothetical protein
MTAMAKLAIEPGAELDGFTIGERVHQGGMATLWTVTHPGITVPLLMKVPRVAEGEELRSIPRRDRERSTNACAGPPGSYSRHCRRRGSPASNCSGSGASRSTGRSTVALRHWAQPLELDESRLTVHVLEAVDPAAAILEFAKVNHADHIVIGARRNSMLRTLLGSVSAKVAGEAACTVTVVRPPRSATASVQERG